MIRKRDADAIQRDIIIASFHPDYCDGDVIAGLRRLKRDRDEAV